MIELMKKAATAGAHFFSNVSGGKDGQAMTRVLMQNGFPVAGLIHADLGEMEWHESLEMVKQQAAEYKLPLHIVRRSDGLGLLQLIERRMNQLAVDQDGRLVWEKPFWPSSASRYCTSDTKRDPINVFYRNHSHDFIISCEGIRASESSKRGKMQPLQINKKCSAKIYHSMTVEQAISSYQPGKRLVIKWFPIFNFSLQDVLATYGHTVQDLNRARDEYKATQVVPSWWGFHPAYAYGNERVSCVFCIMAKGCGDLAIGAQHRPELLAKLVAMETRSGKSFQEKFALKTLLN